MNDKIEHQVMIKAYFLSSPINSWPGGLYEVDTSRMGDSKLKDVLDASASLANEFVAQFLPEVSLTFDHTNFICSSSQGQAYFSAVLADRALSEPDCALVASALHLFCCKIIDGADDIFNQRGPDNTSLTDEHANLVFDFVTDFMAKKNGAKIRDPFVLEFPPIPDASGIAVQGKFHSPVLIERKVGSYKGISRSDGGQITKKVVHLVLIDDRDQECGTLSCSTDEENDVRLACEAAGNSLHRLGVEADELENGRGQRRWVLKNIQRLPDDNPDQFQLRSN